MPRNNQGMNGSMPRNNQGMNGSMPRNNQGMNTQGMNNRSMNKNQGLNESTNKTPVNSVKVEESNLVNLPSPITKRKSPKKRHSVQKNLREIRTLLKKMSIQTKAKAPREFASLNVLDPRNRISPVYGESPSLRKTTNKEIVHDKITPLYRNLIQAARNRNVESSESIRLPQLWKYYAAFLYMNNEMQKSRLESMGSMCAIRDSATKNELIGFYGFLKYLPMLEMMKVATRFQ
jgi:hypothetical protein